MLRRARLQSNRESQLAPTATVASQIGFHCAYAQPRSVQRRRSLLRAVCSWCRPQAACCGVASRHLSETRPRKRYQRSLRRCAVRWGWRCAAAWRLASSPVHNGVAGWSRAARAVGRINGQCSVGSTDPRSTICIQPPSGCPPLVYTTAAVGLCSVERRCVERAVALLTA